MPRRFFFALIATLLATSFLRAENSRLPAAPFAMDNGVGRGTWAPERQASTLRELGYSGISYNYTKPADIKVWQAELKKNGLKFYGLYFGLRLDGDESLPAGMTEALESLRGTETVLWITVPKPAAKAATGLDLGAAALTRLQSLADRAKALGLRVVVYPHKGCHIDTAEKAFALAQQAARPNVGVTVNICHELDAGNGPRLPDIIRRVAPKLEMVSINGATDRPGGAAWSNYIKLLGEGDYDVAAILRTLTEVRYAGPIGVQFFSLKGEPQDNLAATMRAWEKLAPKSKPH
ncbi:MAG: TIM barrel protein [Verrucomicrobiota bacterium]